jgi:hypothetical protein
MGNICLLIFPILCNIAVMDTASADVPHEIRRPTMDPRLLDALAVATLLGLTAALVLLSGTAG